MKILLIGEYSNVHATLAEGLRTLGHQVTVISNGDFWKDYPRDIDVSRPSGPLSGLRLWAYLLTLLPRLRGYDVVQLINPMFFELKAERLFRFYDYLKRHNHRIFLGAFGMDYYWVNGCITDKPLRYSDFNIGSKLRTDEEALKYQRDWLGTAKQQLNEHIARTCDGIVTGLYEYDVCYRPHFPRKTCYIPYPICQGNYNEQLSKRSKTVFFIGINRERSAYKGTDIMLQAALNMRSRYAHRMKLNIAESVPFDQYQTLMEKSDAILDQLYSYTPSMNALLAMSKGIVCIGGGEPEHYELIHETELRPIINVEPTYESVCYAIEQFLLHPERIPELKHQSVEYVRRHHDCLQVTQRYLEFWTA